MSFYSNISSTLARVNLAVVRRTTLDSAVRDAEAYRKHIATHGENASNFEFSNSNQASVGVVSQPALDVQIQLLRHQIYSKWNILDYLELSSSRLQPMLRCPLCEYESARESFALHESYCIFGGGVLRRRQCPACDLIFGPDKMLSLLPQELAQEYEWHYKAYQEGDSTAQELRAFHALKPKPDGVYLNYGAGAWSRSVQILRAEGWRVYGYEPHFSASAEGDYAITGRSALSEMCFDGIFSNNVLEHLRYPVQELRFLKQLLSPGGRMAHATPCFEYLYEFTRFHLFFYTGRSHGVLAELAGLTIKEYLQDKEFMCSVLEAEAT